MVQPRKELSALIVFQRLVAEFEAKLLVKLNRAFDVRDMQQRDDSFHRERTFQISGLTRSAHGEPSLPDHQPVHCAIERRSKPRLYQSYTLRRLGGRQPLCGIGVTSRIVRTS